MTDNSSQAFIERLAELQLAITRVNKLRESVDEAMTEFESQRSLNANTLTALGAIASQTAEALDNLTKATGFLDELRRTMAPLSKQVSQSLYQFQQAMAESVQKIDSGLSSIPRTLTKLESTSQQLNVEIRQTVTDLFVVSEKLSTSHSEISARLREDNIGTLTRRLDLAGPAFVLGTLLGMVMLDLSPLKSATWTIATLAIVVAGLPTTSITKRVRDLVKRVSK
jgi:septation ring formation regulator EzrA